MTLASILIEAGRADEQLAAAEVCERLQISDAELREDINVLNVVNFGGGSYVLYAEITDDGEIEVDPEPYSDNFARPARLLPVEAKALVRGDRPHRRAPARGLADLRAREDRRRPGRGSDGAGLQVARAGGDDSVIARVASEAIGARRLLALDYYKPNEDEFSERLVEPYALVNGREGWYVAVLRPGQGRRAPLPPGPHPPRRGHRRRRSRRAPRSTRPPRSTAGCAPARSRPRASRASGSHPSGRAGRARSAASPRSWPTAP